MLGSIYTLAFTVNLKHEELEKNYKDDVPAESRPTAMAHIEVTLTALLCAFCQGFCSWLLLEDFLKGEENKETKSFGEDQLEPNSIIIVKFICAILFHFKFEMEIRSGIKMMRYAALHPEKFDYAWLAAGIGMVNVVIVVLVEVINLWNLSNITGGSTSDLMFDFIALGIVADFDDQFILIY